MDIAPSAHRQVSKSATLENIAEALNIPVSAFLDGELRQVDDALRMVINFSKISSREARQRCLALVEAEAGKSGNSPPAWKR